MVVLLWESVSMLRSGIEECNSVLVLVRHHVSRSTNASWCVYVFFELVGRERNEILFGFEYVYTFTPPPPKMLRKCPGVIEKGHMPTPHLGIRR